MCQNKNDERYIFFLHNRFLEEHGLNEKHPEFGRTEYHEINYCGNILTIYEKSDPYGISALKRKEASNCEVRYF